MEQQAPIYAWERLEIYAQTNQLARTIGRILAVMPSRLQVHIHNLIGQTVVMANAIAGGHIDPGPGGEPPSVESRRAWLTIGLLAAGRARGDLTDYGGFAKRSGGDVAAGLDLIDRIEAGFQLSLAELDAEPITRRFAHRA
jgi:hypothetical protein